MDAVVRDATMLGIAEFQPVITSRVNRSRAALGRAGVVDRWRRVAIASTKQCGRAVVPRIDEPRALGEVLAADSGTCKIILVEPSARAGAEPVQSIAGVSPPGSCTILVGAEGGWSVEELAEACAAGFAPVTLGRRTLRADAVAIIALAILQFAWGDFQVH
jgi:16S rRNA (uracil1498-N3)-methyltransferase